MSSPESSFEFENEWPDPLDRDFDLYEQYLVGAIDVVPAIPDDLNDDQRELLYQLRAFLEWKYEDGMGESTSRHPEGWAAVQWIRSLPEIEEDYLNGHRPNWQ